MPAVLPVRVAYWREKWLLGASCALLWQARLALSLRGFGNPRTNCLPISAGPVAPIALGRRVAWAIGRAARLTPGATCLVQAMAGRKLLALKGFTSCIRIGVRGSGTGAGFEAHAWLISGDLVVLGGSVTELSDYVPIVGTT